MKKNTSYWAGFSAGLWMAMVQQGMAGDAKASIPKGSEFDKESFQAGIAVGYAVALTELEPETEEKEAAHDGQQET